MKPSEYNPEVRYYQEEHHDYYEVFLKAVPSSARVLELGCGNGGLIDELRRLKGCDVAGVDISIHAEKKCKSKKLKFYRVDMESESQLKKVPFHKYDIVIMAAMLEHMVDPKRFLRMISARLTAKHVVLIGVPTCSDFITRYRVLRGDCIKRYGEKKSDIALGIQPEGHLQFFNPPALCDLVEKTGYAVQRIYYQSAKKLKPFWLQLLYNINHPLFKTFFVIECRKKSR